MRNFYFKQPVFGTTLLLFSFVSFLFSDAIAQTTATIDHNVRRYIGGVSALDRTKFFNLHSNANDADLFQFYEDYNAYPSRGFWGPFSYSKSKGNSIGNYPSGRSGNDNLKNVSRFVATEHPYNVFKDGLDANAAADWVVEYYKDFVPDNERPLFFEPMNEPFVHANEYYEGNWNNAEEDRIKRQMAEVFATIGRKIHDTPALDNMKVIGYSAAWPSLEVRNFDHWRENMKMFMDVAGADMDAFASHLYDGVNVTGQNNKRSGSNSEAILDLIETYSHTKWGTVKPHAITEYGSIASGYGDGYSDIESIQTVKAINHMLFNLLDRENKIDISIPFLTDKSTWHLTAGNNYQPYSAALFIPTNLGESYVAGWRYSPKIHFYELWKDVIGNRVHVTTDNPDIQIQGFANANKLYIALNNLDDQSQNVDLNFVNGLEGFQNLKTKALKIYDNSQPSMDITTSNSAPTSINLIAGETVVLEYTFSNNITFNNVIRDRKYYTSNHLKYINANISNTFNYYNVDLGTGLASIHMGISRKHDRSKSPIVKLNGTTLNVPNNWKGYDQANRDDFFGVIEIPFDVNLLQTNNTITVTFPDEGGHISSMILEVKKYDQDVLPNEDITVINPPSTIMSDTSIDVELAYTANGPRDIVTEFWSSTSWLGQTVQTVQTGSGTETLTISLNNPPSIGQGYVIKASIRPVGSNWTQNIATDQINDIEIIPLVLQEPYGGVASSIPGKVEAENYDEGGEGIAYHDNTVDNQGGQFRFDDVDIETCSDDNGGYNVGWMHTGEWLEYTINVVSDNDYDIFPRVASVNDNAQMKLLVDGIEVTGNLAVPNSGGWQIYQTMHIRNINLTQGKHVIRIEVINGDFNLNSWAGWPSSTSNARKLQVNSENISIYPNPVKDDFIYIKVPTNETSKVEVIDINGRLLKMKSYRESNFKMSLNDLQKGVYIIKITTENYQMTKKIVIQ